MRNGVQSYYERLVLRSSTLPLLAIIALLTAAVLGGALYFEAKATRAFNERNRLLAENVIQNFENTAKMIGLSSHSIIALKYADYAGYRRVVIPWIATEPRILAFSLFSASDEEKLQWSKDGKEVAHMLHVPAGSSSSSGDGIFYGVTVKEGSDLVGTITFKTDLAAMGLDKLAVRPNQGRGCSPFPSIAGSYICEEHRSVTAVLVLAGIFILACGLATFLTLSALSRRLSRELSGPVDSLRKGLERIRLGDEAAWELDSGGRQLFADLAEHISNAARESQNLKASLIANRKASVLASQLCHDIRSPLAALNIMVMTIKDLPESSRTMIRSAIDRINDIANSLEIKAPADPAIELAMVTAVAPDRKAEERATFHLGSVVDSIISEKRLQFRGRHGIEIRFEQQPELYGLFANVEAGELKRVLSNLINNAVEAIGDTGQVVVSLHSKGGMAEIRIADNGKGIQPEMLDKLGQLGATHGKPQGSGLGLFHARICAERWGGQITFDSKPGSGTTVSMCLPKAEDPEWFVPNLEIKPNSKIVIVDDDRNVHLMWDTRLKEVLSSDSRIEILHLSSPAELVAWKKSHHGEQTLCERFINYVSNQVALGASRYEAIRS